VYACENYIGYICMCTAKYTHCEYGRETHTQTVHMYIYIHMYIYGETVMKKKLA
jgi:hypothetical protein